jgi:hypothetical protein
MSLGVVAFLARKSNPFGSSEFQRKVMPYVTFIFGLLAVSGGWLDYSNFAELRDAARNGKAEIIEGQVKEFVPMPYQGHANESFVVNGHRFSYSDYGSTKGFTQ